MKRHLINSLSSLGTSVFCCLGGIRIPSFSCTAEINWTEPEHHSTHVCSASFTRETITEVHSKSYFLFPHQEIQNDQEMCVVFSVLDTSSSTLFNSVFSEGEAGGETAPGVAGRWNWCSSWYGVSEASSNNWIQQCCSFSHLSASKYYFFCKWSCHTVKALTSSCCLRSKWLMNHRNPWRWTNSLL